MARDGQSRAKASGLAWLDQCVAFTQQPFDPRRGDRPTQQPTLRVITAIIAQLEQLLLILDALGDDGLVQTVGHADDARDQERIGLVMGNVGDKTAINLDGIER